MNHPLPANSVHAPDHSAKTRGRLLVITAAVLWSSSGLFAKAPFFEGWPGSRLAFWRALFACLVLVPLAMVHIFSRSNQPQRPLWSWALAPMTLAFAAMNYTYLTAMAEGSAANAIWLQCTAPVWVLLVGVIVFGEKALWRDWLLVGLSAVGVGLILYFESQGTDLNAVLWGLASGALYASVVLALRQLRGMDSAWLAMLNHCVTVACLAPLTIYFVVDLVGPSPAERMAGVERPVVAAPFWPEGIQWPLLLGFGVLQMGIPYVLFARGLRTIPGHEATGIGLIEPILMPIWVLLVWGQTPAWWTIAGAGFILVGLLLRYVYVPPAPSLAEKVARLD